MDTRWILVAQAARAYGYGLTAVLLGTTLAADGLSPTAVGAVLAAVIAGTVASSLVTGIVADRLGRRRTYALWYVVLAVAGAVYAVTTAWPVLALVALLGVLSTEVVESGPFTTLEQAMLATAVAAPRPLVTGFSRYNAVASVAGSLGALTAGAPSVLRGLWPGAPGDQRYYLVLTVVALVGLRSATRLSSAVENPSAVRASEPDRPPLPTAVWRLSALFAADSFAGGFVAQAFVVYWLTHHYGASTGTAAIVMSAVGLLQTASFLAASPLAHRFGLLPTMVFTHIPSNVLLIAFGFAPSLGTAVVLLLVRTLLSQMDVPTRQAYVMRLVPPDQRTQAAAVTNGVRYVTRPAGAALLGPVQLFAASAPFVMAGLVKTGYDLALWAWFRRVPLPVPADLV